MFSYPPVVDAQPQSRWLAAFSGLVGAGIVALAVCNLSRPYIRSLDGLAESTAVRLLQVFVTCAVIVWAVCVIRWRMNRTSIHRLAERTSFDALWLAPLVLFFCQNSIWVVLVTAVFVACVAKSFRSLRENSSGLEEAISTYGASTMFESLDPSPISMEAHQNLGSLMNLDCCKKIEVAIRNKDRYPGTVSLELILTNTTLRGKPSRSLGMKVVKSSLNWIANDKRAPVDEVLSFDIPANTAMHRFDEVTVAFHLASNRARFAPKIGIDRFVLVPR